VAQELHFKHSPERFQHKNSLALLCGTPLAGMVLKGYGFRLHSGKQDQ